MLPPPEPASIAEAPVNPWNTGRIVRGLWIFLAFTLAAFLVLFARGTLGGSLLALGDLRPGAAVLGLLMACLDQVLGGLRMWVAARALGERVRLWPCIEANTGNVFLGGVTPSQTGGGPAQIFLLVRGGATFANASILSGVTFLGTTFVFLFLALRLTFTGAAAALPGGWRAVTGGTGIAFGLILAGFALVLARPRLLEARPLRRLRRHRRVAGVLARADRLCGDFARLMRHALGRGKLWLAVSFLLSALIYANKFLVAVVVLRGLGAGVPLGQVLELQQLQYLVLYFAPTPGASGVAEFSGAAIMEPVVPADRMGVYLVLWRTFSLYAGMAFGALVLFRHGVVGARRGGSWRRRRRAC